MPNALSLQQESLQLNDTIAITGIFPSSGHAGSGSGMTLAMHHTYAFNVNGGMSGLPSTTGQLLTINQNQVVFSLIGTIYGGDGQTNFALPNMILHTSVGAGQGGGLPNHLIGENFGNATATLSTSQLPASLGGGQQPLNDAGPQLTERYMISVNGIFPNNGGNSGASLQLTGSIVKAAFGHETGEYMECDGRSLLISDYQALFSILGTQYGGNGQTTFNLPDLRGRTPVGAGGDHFVGEYFGNDTVNMTNANLPANMGGIGVPLLNEEPSLAITYCIAIDGLFPSQGAGADSEIPFYGEIIAFAGDFVPSGFVACNGQLLSVSQNQVLFSLIGTTYGGDGVDFFAVPDLRDRAIVGMGSPATLGQVTGSNLITLTSADFPNLDYAGTNGDGSHYGGDGNDTISGLGGDDLLVGNDGADKLNGDAGNDVIIGGAGIDTLLGGEDADTITDSYNNTVDGGAGNDTIINTFVDNGTWDGGANIDTLDTSQDPGFSGMVYDLSAPSFNIFDAIFSNFENVIDNGGGNTLIGNAGANTLIGNGGDDTLNGGAGGDILDGGAHGFAGDTVDYAGSTAGVNVNLFLNTASGGHATGDTISGFENVTGSGKSDTIAGDANANVLKGELGTGDMITYANSTALVNVNLTTNVVSGGHAAGDTISGFERVIGSGFDDVLAGTVFANLIAGGGGNDTVFGDAGADSLTGGNGFDTLDHSLSAGGVTINLALNTSSGGNAAGDIIGTFERVNGSNGGVDVLTGTAGVNILRGNGGNDFIEGGAGADILDGGLGSADTVLYTASNAFVTVNLLTNTASGGHAQGDTISGFERVTGSAFGDTLIGNNSSNVLSGGLGNDTLTSGAGADSFVFNTTLGATNIDSITDFLVVSDTIHLDDAIFTTAGALGALNATLFGFAATADASDRIIYDQATGALFYDTNGNVAGERTQFATLSTGLAMTAADFLVV